MTNEVCKVLVDVSMEVERAQVKHPPMNSVHEGYAVLLEEVDEFWDEAKQKLPDRARLREEAVQIAAMAVRIITDCLGES